MLNSATGSPETPRPELTELFHRISDDGQQWAKAEVELAKVELGELKNQAIKAVIFAVVGFAATFCALVVLSQAGIAFLAPYVDSTGVAALIIGGVLLLLVVFSFVVMRNAFSWKTESVFFRWLTGTPKTGVHAQ
jgi:uncharacterized membrane protein YqjE